MRYSIGFFTIRNIGSFWSVQSQWFERTVERCVILPLGTHFELAHTVSLSVSTLRFGLKIALGAENCDSKFSLVI